MQQRLNQSAKVKQSQSLKVDPKVVLSSQMLQLSGLELEQMIESELMENPALERIEDFEEPITDEEIMQSVCPQELKPSSENYEMKRSLPQDGVETDWIDLATSSESLWDHLLAQMKLTTEEELWNLAVYFVGSVNDRGYLTCTIEDAALDCDATLEEAEHVWHLLRQCRPEGVGATDLRDCLQLQLAHPGTDAERLARLILSRNWDDLVARNHKAIIKAYHAPEELVQEAFEVVLTLNPFPGEGFSAGSFRSERVIPAKPDLIINLDEYGWTVEVPGPTPVNLRVSHAYKSRKEELENRIHVDAAEKRHLTEFVDRANRFISALTQRRQQLAKIGKYLIEHQAGFMKTGEYRFLKELTRSKLASDLGIHESTVSRATNGKFIQIATKDVVSFDVFFKPALRIQKIIEEILQSENPDNPLSDEGIAKLLADRGIHVARRTVNKYRDRNKLLSSRMRKMA